MRKNDFHPYIAAGLTAFAVLAGGILLFFGVFHWGAVLKFLNLLAYTLRPVFCGMVLAFLLLPGKFTALLFAALFGLYPMVKALGERLRVRGVEYAVKLAFFNASLTVAYFAMRAALTASLPGALGAVWALYAVGNVVFLIYDYGLSRLFALYMKRIQRNIR